MLLTRFVDTREVLIAEDGMREIGRLEGAKYILERANAKISTSGEDPDDTAKERRCGVLKTKSEGNAIETKPEGLILASVLMSSGPITPHFFVQILKLISRAKVTLVVSANLDKKCQRMG